MLHGVRISLLALRGQLLFAVIALGKSVQFFEKAWSSYITTSNLEGRNDTVSNLKSLDTRTHRLDLSTELMSQDVTLLHLDHRTMHQVKITSANSASRYLQDDITVLNNSWFGDLHFGDILSDFARILDGENIRT
jgi:hypothetical protein